MDSAARSQRPSFLTEDWVRLGYREGNSDLTSDIHPLFQRTNAFRPRGAEYIWPQYNSVDAYDELFARMGAIFRMASKILETPKSLDFLYQVAYSRRNLARGDLSHEKRPCKEFGWAEPMSKALGRQMATNALRRLSRSLMFQMGDPEVNPSIRGAIAVTRRSSGFQKGVKIDDVANISGVASKIILNRVYILKLIEIDAQEGDNATQKMSLQLKMAITLCHEIAHALAFAVDSELLEMVISEQSTKEQADMENRPYEPRVPHSDELFYRNETMAEIGNCWENQVFGGKIGWSGNTSDPLFVSKWPSFLTSDGYYPTRGREKRTAREYIVSFHYVRNMHRQGFWDNVVPGDPTVLYVKKTIGIEYINPDAEATSINSSEINWPLDANSSRVSREGDGQRMLDPSASCANETAEERYARELT